jgi:hypothetical protein
VIYPTGLAVQPGVTAEQSKNIFSRDLSAIVCLDNFCLIAGLIGHLLLNSFSEYVTFPPGSHVMLFQKKVIHMYIYIHLGRDIAILPLV